ncbi:MAG: VOC family protein [Myxococcales bacterium]|nr:VOC family protein [Myxococcales bacterium]
MPQVEAVPHEYGSITPYLVVSDGDAAIRFYEKAFGAQTRLRVEDERGVIRHAELDVGDSVVMLSEATDEWKPTSSMICLYVEDCDTTFQRAVDAGAEVIRGLEDHFYGDRAGMIRDPFGQYWSIMTHKRDVSPEEMQAHMSEH